MGTPQLDLPARPGLEPTAAQVLDLYAREWQGTPLDRDDYVVCADEKTSIQARCRCHPTLSPATSRPLRVEHEYERGGALADFAAWDVHRAKLFGRREPTTGIAPFKRLVAQVMTSEPYASARQVFWVVDNGSSHRGGLDQAPGRGLAPGAAGPHPRPLVVVEPGGDLPVDLPA